MQKFAAAQGQLSGALSRLLVTVERYPELKSDRVFQGLMTELEGTENRIAVARRNFNEAVKQYNGRVQFIPGSLVASMRGDRKSTRLNSSHGYISYAVFCLKKKKKKKRRIIARAQQQ